MKIGITCYPTYGGSGVVATELGKALAGRGHEIHFICSQLPYRLSQPMARIFYHEVKVMSYPIFEYVPYSLALASQMVNVAEQVGLDLLHVHYAVPHAASAILAQQTLKNRYLPVITTLHGTDITIVGNDPSYLPICEFSINRSDIVTAVSNYLKTATLRDFHVTKEILVVPNGVDLGVFCRRPCSETFKNLNPKGEKLLMHISNFRPVKRIPDVIRVFDAVRKRIPSRLVLVGDGPERQLAERTACQLGLGPQEVAFLGKVEVSAGVLACADLLLLPSDAESFGLVALEAMACEVPVIGSMAGGLPEVVADGKTGFLSPVGDWEGMARNSLKVLQDADFARQMGREGRKRAREHFCEDDIVCRYEEIYRQAVAISQEKTQPV